MKYKEIGTETIAASQLPFAGSPVMLTPSLLRKAIAFSMFDLRADEDDGLLLTNGISAFAGKKD